MSRQLVLFVGLIGAALPFLGLSLPPSDLARNDAHSGPPPEAFAQSELVYDSAAVDGGPGHFSIYYEISGYNQVLGWEEDNGGVVLPPEEGYLGCYLHDGDGPESYDASNAPDYIEELACYLEYSLEAYRQAGFNSGEIPGNMSGIVHIKGYTQDSSATSFPPHLPVVGGEMYFDLDVADEVLPTLAAHEVFHQFQYAYIGHLTSEWILEGTAKWAEDIVFDERNRYVISTNLYLEDPGQPLRQAAYRSVLFWRYLTEHYGHQDPEAEMSLELMMALLEAWTQTPEIAGVNLALQQLGISEDFDFVFADQFVYANYLKRFDTGNLEYDYLEDEEAGYVDVAIENEGGDLLLSDQSLSFSGQDVGSYGANYYRILPEKGISAVEVQVDGQSDFRQPKFRAVAIYQEGAWLDFYVSDTRQTLWRIELEPGLTELVVIIASLKGEGRYDLTVSGL